MSFSLDSINQNRTNLCQQNLENDFLGHSVLALCSRLEAEEIEQRLRMPLSYIAGGGEGPEDICDRVVDMIRKRLNIGEDKKSSMCQSVAFKVGCQIAI